jgi:lysophospholipase L1-like esterase
MANILVFGASTTQGHYDKKGGWADRIKQYCTEKSINSNLEKYYEVYNLGRAGDTTEDLLKRFDNEIKARFWDDPVTVIIIAIGMNDSAVLSNTNKNWVSKNKYSNNLNKLYEIGKKYTDKIVFIGLTPVDESLVNPIPWVPDKSYLDKEMKDYDNLIKKFCEERNLDYIHILDRLRKKHLADGVHPTTKGHEIIFAIVNNFLEEKGYI